VASLIAALAGENNAARFVWRAAGGIGVVASGVARNNIIGWRMRRSSAASIWRHQRLALAACQPGMSGGSYGSNLQRL